MDTSADSQRHVRPKDGAQQRAQPSAQEGALAAPGVAGDQPEQQIERDRARKFLVSHWLILAVTALTMAANMASGALGPEVVPQFFSMTLIIGGVTALGTLRYRANKSVAGLVAATLYIDSAVGLIYFYLMGEYETPAMGLLTIPIIMAPIYAARRTVWGIAGLQIALYLFLMAGRIGGWLDPVLHYGDMVILDEATREQFLTLSIGAFITVTVAVAMLSGEATLDVLTSRDQLEEEVSTKTQALQRAQSEVEETNADLATANDDLASVNHKLVNTNAALADFNAAISHDLRSPLQTMILHLELMLAQSDGPGGAQILSDDARVRLNKTLTAAERMGRMVTDLQDLSSSTQTLQHLVSVNLNDVFAQVIDDLAARISRAQAQVQLVDTLPTVMGKLGLLRRLLQNLIENAVKYGGPDEVHVRVGALPTRDGRVGIYVEDSGPGIDKGDQERIFALFQRLERDAAAEGTGAGLAIVNRIIHAHGGSIEVVAGQLLTGARFEVRFKKG